MRVEELEIGVEKMGWIRISVWHVAVTKQKKGWIRAPLIKE